MTPRRMGNSPKESSPKTPKRPDSSGPSEEKDNTYNPVVMIKSESEIKDEQVNKQPRRAQWRIPTRRETSSNPLNFEAGISVYQRTANNSIHRNFETPMPNVDYRNAPMPAPISTLKSFPKRAHSNGQKSKHARDQSSDSGSKELTVYCVLRDQRKHMKQLEQNRKKSVRTSPNMFTIDKIKHLRIENRSE